MGTQATRMNIKNGDRDIAVFVYKQLDGPMLRVDVTNGTLDDVPAYRENYKILDSWVAGDRITYYIQEESSAYNEPKNYRFMYTTHSFVSSFIEEGGRRKKVYAMNTCMVTPSGTYPLKEWQDTILNLAKEKGESDMVENLKNKALELKWIKTEVDALQNALQGYSYRLFKS